MDETCESILKYAQCLCYAVLLRCIFQTCIVHPLKQGWGNVLFVKGHLDIYNINGGS